MRSNYERKKYVIRYLTIWALFVSSIVGYLYYEAVGNASVIGIVFAICVVFGGIGLVSGYSRLNHLYGEIEHVAGSMLDVMNGKEPEAEEYKEGSVGILYTNYYKMVQALKESRDKELEEKIFLRDIISDISHQLKTPLASLNVFVDLLLENRLDSPEKQKEVLQEASNQLSRMEWMVLSMLKLARIEAGAIQFDKTPCVLELLLQQAVNGVKYLTDARAQKVTVRCDTDQMLVCDGDWLTEAVINLLKNASDYSNAGCPIEVEVEDCAVYTRIYIKDHGMGIPESEYHNIFKRFYRVHREVNPNSVGIGLPLCKSIVEGMGGTLTVRSEVGQYTWFLITFSKNHG